jgi:hypothetical protein
MRQWAASAEVPAVAELEPLQKLRPEDLMLRSRLRLRLLFSCGFIWVLWTAGMAALPHLKPLHVKEMFH